VRICETSFDIQREIKSTQRQTNVRFTGPEGGREKKVGLSKDENDEEHKRPERNDET
jgi:hypothetical protein